MKYQVGTGASLLNVRAFSCLSWLKKLFGRPLRIAQPHIDKDWFGYWLAEKKLISYSHNGHVLSNSYDAMVKVVSVQISSKTILLVDANPFSTTSTGGQILRIPEVLVRNMSAALARVGYIHQSKANTLWCDGHVNTKSMLVYYDLKIDKKSYKVPHTFNDVLTGRLFALPIKERIGNESDFQLFANAGSR